MEQKNKNLSALHEKPGIAPPEMISTKSVGAIQRFRKIQPTSKELVEGILAENITALSRAITLVESTSSTHLAKANEVITACLPHANKSVRIGITGVPGVGKVLLLRLLENT